MSGPSARRQKRRGGKSQRREKDEKKVFSFYCISRVICGSLLSVFFRASLFSPLLLFEDIYFRDPSIHVCVYIHIIIDGRRGEDEEDERRRRRRKKKLMMGNHWASFRHRLPVRKVEWESKMKNREGPLHVGVSFGSSRCWTFFSLDYPKRQCCCVGITITDGLCVCLFTRSKRTRTRTRTRKKKRRRRTKHLIVDGWKWMAVSSISNRRLEF